MPKKKRKPMSKADRAAFAARMKAARNKSGKAASKKPSGKIPWAMGKLTKPGKLYTESGKPFKGRAKKKGRRMSGPPRVSTPARRPSPQRISTTRRALW